MMRAVKFVGGEGRWKCDHICFVKFDPYAELHQKLLDEYCFADGAKRGTVEFAGWQLNQRNMALAIVRTVIPWFHEDGWEIVPESSAPKSAPDYVGECFEVWYFKNADAKS